MSEKVELYYKVGKTVKKAETILEHMKVEQFVFETCEYYPKEVDNLNGYKTLIVVGSEEKVVNDGKDDWYDVALNMTRKQKLKAIENG